MTCGEMINRTMRELGLGEMPGEAFTDKYRYFDWYYTAESQELLDYQNHTYDDWLDEIKKRIGPARRLVGLFQPIARWCMLRQSPYFKKNGQAGNISGIDREVYEP